MSHLGISAETLMAWFHARDLLLGMNQKRQNLSEGLRLARECALCGVADAQWLIDLFPNEERVMDGWEAKRIFLAKGDQNDSRSLVFAGLVAGKWDHDQGLIRSAAEMGNGLAEAWMAHESNGNKRLTWALKAASKLEPLGMFVTAFCYHKEFANLETALLYGKKAAELGWVHAQYWFGMYGFCAEEFGRYDWICESVRNGWDPLDLILEIRLPVMQFLCNSQMGNCVFLIGQTLRWHVDFVALKEVHGEDDGMSNAVCAISIFERLRDAARQAVQAWVVCAIRMKVNQDLIGIIGKMVWNGRREGNYFL